MVPAGSCGSCLFLVVPAVPSNRQEPFFPLAGDAASDQEKYREIRHLVRQMHISTRV